MSRPILFSLTLIVVTSIWLTNFVTDVNVHPHARRGGTHVQRSVNVAKFKANSRPFPEDHWSQSPRYRLPKSIKPKHYALKIIPILESEIAGHDQFTAPGSVWIDVECLESTNNVTLHASPELQIAESSIRISDSSNVTVPILGYERQDVLEFFIIKLGAPLQTNSAYQIYIEFVAPIATDVLHGLYLSTYLKPQTNEPEYTAATQFQKFSFRRMVPAFDEPNLKATFDISIGYLPTKYNTLSNTDVVSTSIIDTVEFQGWMWDNYRTTVVMSCYLIALLVSDFTYEEAPPGLYRKPVRIYGVQHQIANGDGRYAAETSARMLTFYEEYYETEYSMPKMDAAAIPQFRGHGMENWGLNTYRPIFLLHTADVTTEKERGAISHLLAHELGHQWFGNLVTCAWWNDLWLNEGLTTYASVIAWQHTQPEFEPLKYFHVNAFQDSLSREEFASSAGKQVQNNGSHMIVDNFKDLVTQRKGSCLVKMMDSFLGPETVRKGIVNYLHGLSYQGATQDDLFAYLSAQAEADSTLLQGLTVKDIMDTWIYNRGFPILYVYNVTGDDTNIHILQQQYRGRSSTQEDSAGWYIPVAVATENHPNFESVKPQMWMNPLQTHATFSVGNLTKWVIVNPSARGYYRVVYNLHLTRLIWEVLAQAHNSISPQSRSQLIDDYFMTAFQNATDFTDIETALGFTKYLGREYDRIVWETLIINLKSTFDKLMGTQAFPEFKKYFLPKIMSTFSIIGFRQESHHKGANVILRSLLLEWVCKMESEDCNAYTKELMDRWKLNPLSNPIPPDLQAIIYCNAIANGTQTDIDFIWGQYKIGTEMQKLRLLDALACSKQTSVLQSLLEEAVQKNSRFTYRSRAILQVAANPLGTTLTLNFLNSNLTDIIDQIGIGFIPEVVNTLAVNMATTQEYAQVAGFINESILPDSLVTFLRDYLSYIQENIDWRSNYVVRMANWFRQN